MVLRPEMTALVSAIVVFVFFAVAAGNAGFLTLVGTRNYLQVAAMIGIVGTPVTLLLVAGEFDLSVGTMIGAAGIVVAYPIVTLGWPLWAAVLAGLAFAGIVGAFNGLIVTRLTIPSFLVTLGTMFVLRGLGLAVSQARIIASGGVATLAHVESLLTLGAAVEGVIIGKALYDGKLQLADALRVAADGGGVEGQTL